MTRTSNLAVHATLALLMLGCSGEASDKEPPPLDWIENRPAPAISWEKFKAEATRTYEGKTFYVVEWDIGMQTEAELRAYYDAMLNGQRDKAMVWTLPNGADDVWSKANVVSLTYCIDNAFGTHHTRAVNEMASATRAWEQVANVRFIYLSQHNGNCTPSNSQVKIPVRPWTLEGACAFNPSKSGGCVLGTLVMNFVDFDTNPRWDVDAPNVTTTGVFRHELGHVLGLRHEHTHPSAGPTGRCLESNNWRQISPYNRQSVMHYQWCNNGDKSVDLVIRNTDAEGMRVLYGMPVSWLMTILK